jgi:cytochrome b involved in lipid metabolism
MRKLLVLTLSIVLSIALAPIAKSSEAEPGKRCKKIGQRASDDGQTLVCRKKGNRNVWVVANKQQPKPTASASPSATATQEPSSKGITRAEVASKNSSSSCWTIIGNKVYDVTEFIGKHKGGSGRIENLCGKDGTSNFRGQHGTSGGPNLTLDRYYIGDLKS